MANTDAGESYRQVLENNRKWAAKRKIDDPAFFENLARGQSPEFLFIGCADSRVPESELMGLGPGDVFVSRNVANLVVNTDPNIHAVMQYAVEALRVKHIIVCGHYGCGGVKAAMGHSNMHKLNLWLREIRDVYFCHRDELEAIDDEDKRYERLIELNVYEQCCNVMKTSFYQKHFLANGYPEVHGWVFDIANGLIHDQHFPFREVLADLDAIYGIRDEE